MAKKKTAAAPAPPPPASLPAGTNVVTVYGTTAVAPTVINEWAVLGIPAVWRAVGWISETLAGLPKAVWQQTGNLYQRVDTHPLNKILARKINPTCTPFVFWQALYGHSVIWGGGYGIIGRRSAFDPAVTGIYTVTPDRVLPFRLLSDGSQWYKVDGAELPVPAADVIHIPGFGYDGMCGYPLVQVFYELFEWARNAQKFGAKYLKKGTQVQGSIELPAGAKKEQIDAIHDALARRHQGIDGEYTYVVLSGGASLKNTTIPPQQSQLVETTKALVLDIARAMNVPPWYLFELGEAKWANVEQQALDAVRYSLRPWIEKSEEELTAKLLTPAEQDAGLVVRIDVDDLIRGDSKTLTDTTLAKVNAGVLSVNEGRAVFGYAPHADPKANELRTPAGAAPVAATTGTDKPTKE